MEQGSEVDRWLREARVRFLRLGWVDNAGVLRTQAVGHHPPSKRGRRKRPLQAKGAHGDRQRVSRLPTAVRLRTD